MKQQRLGEFVIGREIGRGGMGVVYEALQTSLNRKVALKVLASSIGLTAKAVQRFHREAEAAAKLHHTNIVPIYATGDQDGAHFYAMELIDGPSLDQVIRQLRHQATDQPATPTAPAEVASLDATGPHVTSPTPSGSGLSSSTLSSGSGYFDTAARMIAEVADALEYAHQQGVIHRDIKPSNLLLSPAGRLSVNDFGLARMLEQPGMTITGEMVGTPRYMSPEQITAGRVPVDHRTDIYSLGATLYELLTLRPPFLAEHRDQLLAQVIQKEPARPRTVNPRLPVDLETICLKALDKDPDRRYQTAGQMADDLRRYVNRFAILARRAGPLGRLWKWVRRNPALAASLAGVLLCVGVAGGLVYRARLQEQAHQKELLIVEQERLDEKRRSVLEKAILEAHLRNFDGARQAIREAEKLGCSAGQVRMLQGQLELYHGHMKEAIDHLQQATELLSESVQAWSMLAVGYYNAGRMTEYYQALGAATRLTPVQSEDYLFLGHAESLSDADRGLRSLDEAVRQRPSSVLAQLIRTDVLKFQVLDSPDLEKARTLMSDIQAIKRQFPDNLMVIALSISIHTVCFHVFDDLQQPELRQAALSEGLADAKALHRFEQSSHAMWLRWSFLDEIGQAATALADTRRACNENKDSNLVFNVGVFLYRQGNMEEAVKLMELCKGESVLDFVRLMALAELPDGPVRANELFKEIAARDLDAWNLFNSQLILRFLGRKQEAEEVSRKFLNQPERFPPLSKEPFQRALEYCAGKRSAEDLIAAAGGKRHILSNAYLCIALTALAEGDRAKAKQHLQLCVGTHFYEALPYSLSMMLLSRMNKDPTWPPWIKIRP